MNLKNIRNISLNVLIRFFSVFNNDFQENYYITEIYKKSKISQDHLYGIIIKLKHKNFINTIKKGKKNYVSLTTKGKLLKEYFVNIDKMLNSDLMQNINYNMLDTRELKILLNKIRK